MEAVFLEFLNMSITASWLVLAVVVLRLLLKKAPKALVVVMWALVGIRLICPFSFESVLSLIPSAETIPSDIIYSNTPVIQSGISSLDSTVNPIISETLAPDISDSISPMQVILFFASSAWIAGVVVMLLYTLISYFRIYRQVREAILLKDNIWLCDYISTPFILGVIRPRIYLPSSMRETDIEYAIAHEKAHLKRHDHWWKPLGFLLLTIYWFNPILWIAYVLFCRDIELACDEKVLKGMGTEVKKLYSNALINCSVSSKIITACPLAFGEISVKARIKSVLNYKVPAFWVIIATVIVCIGVGACFLTNPSMKASEPEALGGDESKAEEYITTENGMYLYKGTLYKYKKVLTGKTRDAFFRLQYTVLTNDEDITFEQVAYRKSSDSLLSTTVIDMQTLDYFTEEEMNEAKAVVEEYFRARRARDREAVLATLTEKHATSDVPLWQDEDIVLRDIKLYSVGVSILCEPGEYVMGSEEATYDGITYSYTTFNGISRGNWMSLNVSLTVTREEGGQSMFNRNKYDFWRMILVRDGEDGEWLIHDLGY